MLTEKNYMWSSKMSQLTNTDFNGSQLAKMKKSITDMPLP